MPPLLPSTRILTFLIPFVLPTPAAAQSLKPDIALAESLFQEGRRLMAEGKLDQACPKLAESQRLDPATGTLLNVAACYEQQGKTATAWTLFREALGLARSQGIPERVLFAEQRLRLLEPQLLGITIVVPAEANVPGLQIELDGAVIAVAARGVRTPVDPGKHIVTASAPDRKRWTSTVEIDAAARNQRLVVPVLETAELEPKPLVGTTAPQAVRTPASSPEQPPAKWSNAPFLVSSAATVLCLGGAIVTGVAYLSKRAEYNEANTPNAPNAPNADALRGEMVSLGIANLALTGGAIVGTITSYLVFSSHSRAEKHGRLRLEPRFSLNAASVTLGGAL